MIMALPREEKTISATKNRKSSMRDHVLQEASLNSGKWVRITH